MKEQPIKSKEEILKECVAKVLNIDFNDKGWYVHWWMLLDPEPSIKRIYAAMEEYKNQFVQSGEERLLAETNLKAYDKLWNEKEDLKQQVEQMQNSIDRAANIIDQQLLAIQKLKELIKK